MNFSNIYSSSNTTNTVQQTQYSVDESLFKTLMFIEKESFQISKEHAMSTHNANFYSEDKILTEGFKEFIDSAKEFFKKMIIKIKEFFSKAYMMLRSIVGDFDKFLNKYDSTIRGLNPDFSIDGYKYTIEASVPDTSIITEIIGKYNTEISHLDTMSKEDIISRCSKDISAESINKLRGTILRESAVITESDFSEYTKKFFRNGDDTKHDIHIGTKELHSSIDVYKDLKKMLSTTIKDKDNVEKALFTMKNFFEKKPSLYYSNGSSSYKTNRLSYDNEKIRTDGDNIDIKGSELMQLANTYFEYRFRLTKSVSSIIVTVFYEKMIAIKEAMKFHQSVIRRSLSAGSSVKEES